MRLPRFRLRTLLVLIILALFFASAIAYLGAARRNASPCGPVAPDQPGESPSHRSAAIVEPGLPTDGGLLIPLDERRGFAAASFSPDGADLAVVWHALPGVTIYDSRHGGVRAILDGGGYPGSVAHTPGGDLLIIGRDRRESWRTREDRGRRDAFARLIDARDGHVKATPLRGIQAGRLVDLSPDGRWLAATDPDAIFVWDLAEDHEEAWLAHVRSGWESRLVFSPDGRALAVADGVPGKDGSLILWDIRGRTTRALPLPEKPDGCYKLPFSDLDFSPDGTRLAGAIEDVKTISGGLRMVVTVVIWDVATARIVARSDEQKGPGWDMRGYRLRFTPDGRWLISAYSRRVSRHDPRTGEVVDFRDPAYGERGGPVHVLAFSRDGTRLAALNYGPYQGETDDLYIREIGRLFDSPPR